MNRVTPRVRPCVSEYLARIDRSPKWLSRKLQCNDMTVYRWLHGDLAPPDIIMAWLESYAASHASLDAAMPAPIAWQTRNGGH